VDAYLFAYLILDLQTLTSLPIDPALIPAIVLAPFSHIHALIHWLGYSVIYLRTSQQSAPKDVIVIMDPVSHPTHASVQLDGPAILV